MNGTIFKLIQADAANMPIADECIDLTVTSPPYDNLRTYQGFRFDFESVANELFRVTKRGGTVVWVVSDATIKGSETGTSFRQALYFKEIGFNLHDTMIYQKESRGAVGSNLAYWSGFEYMFVFTKGKPKTFSPIVDRCNKSAGRVISGTNRKPNGSTAKHWKSGELVSDFSKRTNVWLISEGFRQSDHPASFPEKLAQDHILSWSNEGDTVLDCFCGSGTTGKMALLNNRNFIGLDISRDYLKDIALPRMKQTEHPLFATV